MNRARLKGACVSALIALILALPLAGLVITPDASFHLGLVFHPLPVMVIVAGAFLLRLVWGLKPRLSLPSLPEKAGP